MTMAWLLAPGARLPVSIEPSLSTTRCVTESLFLNTTVWPASAAGFGENACVPFELLMVMVAAVLPPLLPPLPPDGAVGVELP